LWELYLTNAAHLAPDHVHEDAEKIEHILGEETVLKLEKRLNYARRDPHGRLIPGLQDIRAGGVLLPSAPAAPPLVERTTLPES
jgi:manganese/zinc/iron transport system permease protein